MIEKTNRPNNNMRSSVPSLDAPEGWKDFKLFSEAGLSSFVSSDPDSDRLRVRYYHNGQTGAFMGKVWFGPGAEGPPGMVHGGAMAAVLDEGMGVAAWLSGHKGVAAKLTVNFRKMLPLGTVTTIEAWVKHTEGRKIVMEGHLIGPEKQVYSESEGLYVQVDLCNKIQVGA